MSARRRRASSVRDLPPDLRARLEGARLETLALLRALDAAHLSPRDLPQPELHPVFALDADCAEALWALDQLAGTLDVAAMLRDSVVGLAGRETAIGDAIALAVKRLREQPEGNRVLVLLTDGANTAGQLEPLAAAELARQAGVRIYTIGIGGGEVGIRTPLGMRLIRQGGDFDPATLKRISDLTGGRAFSAAGREELEAVYAELDRLEPSERDERTYRPRETLFVWPAGAVLVLTVLIALGGLGAGVRSRQEGERNAR